MDRSKTRILLANIQMAVRVSRFSPTSHVHQFPCHVSNLTILISKRSIIYYLMPKLQQTLVKAVLLIQGYGPIDAELLADLSFYEKLRCEDRSTDQTEYVKGSQEEQRTTSKTSTTFLYARKKLTSTLAYAQCNLRTAKKQPANTSQTI